MANLTLSDTITKIEVSVSLESQLIKSIYGWNGSTYVGQVPDVDGKKGLYDTTSAPFLAAKSFLTQASPVIHEYRIGLNPGFVTYRKDQLPMQLERVKDWDPLLLQIGHEAQSIPDIGPANVVLYKYAASAPTSISATATASDDDTLSEILENYEDDGWFGRILDAQADNASYASQGLHYFILRYHYDGDSGVWDLSEGPIDGSSIQYSIDYGRTYSYTIPANQDDITNYRVVIGGDPVDITVKTEQELLDPVGRIIGSEYPPLYSDAAYPDTVELEDADVSERYAYQIVAERLESWSDGDVKFGGPSPILTLDEIVVASPSLIDWKAQDSSNYNHLIQGGRGTYILAVHEDRGTVFISQPDHTNMESLYNDNDYYSLLFCFEGYPRSTLHTAMSATQTTLNFIGTRRGFSVGDTLFVNSEKMEVTSLGVQNLADDTIYRNLTVTRGTLGTTAAEHDIGDTVRAVYNKNIIRRLTFLDEHGITRPFRIRLLGFKKYEVEAA